MNSIVTLALKDLRLLVRDKFGLFWILIFPLMFALFFGAIFAGTGSPSARALTVAVIDEDQTEASKAFVKRLGKQEALSIKDVPLEQAREDVLKGKLVAYVVLKKGFGKTTGFAAFFPDGSKEIELGVDPARKAEIGFLQGMLTAQAYSGLEELFKNPGKARKELPISQAQFEKNEAVPESWKTLVGHFLGGKDLPKFLEGMEKLMVKEGGKASAKVPKMEPVKIEVKEVSGDQGGRPRSSFEITFPSSILWALLGCVAAFSISIVTERVQGTWLRLRTSPLSWGQLLAGKGLACFLACAIVTVVLLLLAWLVLGVRLDQPLKLALAIVCTALCFTGIMMFISTLGKTEQGVAGAGWGIMMPLAMLGGGMVPLIAMPGWMLTVSNVSPVKWGIVSLEGAIWRGFSYEEMLLPCGILLAVGAVFAAVGVMWLSRREA
jgi:ABC-2 type transport system permease protein